MRKVGVKPIRTPMNEHSTPEDLVRQHTCPAINQKIDDELAARVRLYSKAGRDALSRRIEELEHEWDVERLLEANASSLILTGTLLGAAGCRRVPPGAAGCRRWLLVPAVVSGFLLYHALRGWCPPIPIFRRLGVRTRKEIERERYAFKAARCDFDDYVRDESRDTGKLMGGVTS